MFRGGFNALVHRFPRTSKYCIYTQSVFHLLHCDIVTASETNQKFKKNKPGTAQVGAISKAQK